MAFKILLQCNPFLHSLIYKLLLMIVKYKDNMNKG